MSSLPNTRVRGPGSNVDHENRRSRVRAGQWEHRLADDPSLVLDSARDGGVPFQEPVSPAAVGGGRARLKCPQKVPFAEGDDGVGALPSERSDHPLHERILPRTLRSRHDLLDLHGLELIAEGAAVDRVAIAQQEPGLKPITWERLDGRASGPRFGGVLGDGHVHDSSAVVGEDHEAEGGLCFYGSRQRGRSSALVKMGSKRPSGGKRSSSCDA